MSASEAALPEGDTRGPRSRERADLETLAILGGQLAHEFNELLVGVLGNATLAMGKVAEESPAYPNIAEIEAAALRAKDLVGVLVRFCGSKRVALGAVRVEEVVRAAVAGSGVPAHHVVVRVASGVGDVSGAACQLRHLVGSLLANALEATAGRESGAVRVTVAQTELGEPAEVLGAAGQPLPAGSYVEIVVADDGNGVDAATRARVFEPCFTTRRGARGLGLTAALRIAAAHRGSIEVESEPGRGTSVRVLLPVRHPAPTRRRSVLVVDDDEGVRTVTRALLEAAGYDVLVADGGLEAVDLFRAHSSEIDVVVLDRNMPRVGGEATLRALRRVREDVRVLLCSGGGADDGIDRLLANGVAGFVAKPFTSETLLAAVAAAL